MAEKKTVDLVVIGAGPAGYAAALAATKRGRKVTLVDPETAPGGVCLHRGCIPSKALLHVAKLVGEAREAQEIGITFGEPKIDVDRVREWKNEVIGKLTGGLAQKMDGDGIDRIKGKGRFLSPTELQVDLNEGGELTLTFAQAILATGSRPIWIPGVEPGERIIDSTGALELADVPPTLMVIGGGYIGLELGSAYAALGSKVTVVEMGKGLLPGCDRDLVSVLQRRQKGVFEEILLETKVTDMKSQKNGVAVTLEDKKGKTIKKRFAKVLMSIGRRPHTEGLGLENTGVVVTDRGFVQVDAQQRTAESTIFAIGDIAGDPMLAHKAYGEAEVVAAVVCGEKDVFDPRAIPAVVFTDPEIAWCGITETEAKAEKRKVKVAKFPWRANGRALSLGRDDGMTKLIVDPESDRLLGMAVVGPGAGELIAEGVLALEMAAVAEDLRRTIHPHPTLSETVYEAAHMV